MLRRFRRFALIAIESASLAAVAHAADPVQSNFVEPAFYGQPNATYQEWNGFTDPKVENTPTYVSNAGSPTWTDATSASDQSYLIGNPPHGHVYSDSGVLHLRATVPVPTLTGAKTTIVIQTETLGLPLDLTSYLATPTAGGTSVAPTVASHYALGDSGSGFGGTEDYEYVEWDNLPGDVGSYTITYTPNSAHSSQTVVRIDTLTAVPEPAAGLLLVGATGLLIRRRRSTPHAG